MWPQIQPAETGRLQRTRSTTMGNLGVRDLVRMLDYNQSR